MARLSKEVVFEKFSQFKDRMLGDTEFIKLGNGEKAEEIGVHPATIGRWLKELTDDDWVVIRENARKRVARVGVKVDLALDEKAASGDVKAIELWKQVNDHWSVKTIHENINKNEDVTPEQLEALRKEAAKELSREELLKILSEKELKVVNGDGGGETGANRGE